MNKTVSISLSGQVFQIDEQAYDKLKTYLENIRRRFSASDGGAEIIADIEARIAELFNEKLNDKKQVITLPDVEAMTLAMGKPEDFETGSESAESAAPASGSRRLYRNPDEKILGGVCSGLSAYFGINDPIWMRLLVIISPFITAGTALFIYIILWIIIPEAKTASEKLQMRGEHVNISSIEKTIREDLSDLGQRISNIHNGDSAAQARTFLQRAVDFCIAAVVVLVKLAGKAIGVLVIFIGLALIAAILLALLLPSEMTNISVGGLYPAIFSSNAQFLFAATGLLLVVAVPAVGLMFGGFHLLISGRKRIKGLGLGLFLLWIVGIISLVAAISRTAVDFQQTESVRTEIPLAQPAKDTLVLEALAKKIEGKADAYVLPEIGDFYLTENELVFAEKVKLDIKKSDSGNYELVQTGKAAGRKNSSAEERASNIRYEVAQNDSAIVFSDYFSVPVQDHYRSQEVQLLLKVPEGKAVFLSNSVANILYDVQNTVDMYDADMAGHTWMMLPGGLTCMDCTAEETRNSETPQDEAVRDFNFKEFDNLDVRGAFTLEVRKGDFSVAAGGEPGFAENLQVSKDGSSLLIDMKNASGFWSKENGTVTVTLPELNKIKITGANNATISGFQQDKMSLIARGASKVNFNASVDELELEAAGASTVTLTGSGSSFSAEVNGASKLKAFSYEVSKCSLEVNGASDAEVNASQELDAEANGASNIRYKGLPKISSDVTGYSSIKPER